MNVLLRLPQIQNGGLCPLRSLPLMIELLVPLRGIAPENSWLGRRFFEGLQNYMQIKMREIETK